MRLQIKDLKVHVIATKPPPASYYARVPGRGDKRYLGILRIISEEGLEGHAFVSTATAWWDSPRHITPLTEDLKPFLVGEDALARERIWHRMRQLAPRWDVGYPSIMAVDVALWDLAAKAANLPLYRLLGAYRDKIPVFASAPFYPDVEVEVESALACKERGMRGYKLHHVVPDLKESIDRCKKLREAVGDDMDLMFDGGGFYTLREALYVGRVLDELNFRWFEDPMNVNALDALADLGQRIDTPVALSDSRDFRFADAANAIRKKAARVLRTDPPKDGVTGMKKLADLCEAHNLNVEYHDSGNAYQDVAILHVALSVQNTSFFPWVMHTQEDPFGLVENIAMDSEGYIHGPERPGLGVEIDWKLIDRFTEVVL
jgi:L-alanine-DL-glutamate epimerase-like enolase superfamily enzyme